MAFKVDVEVYPERFGDGNILEMFEKRRCSGRINMETNTVKVSVILTRDEVQALIEALGHLEDAFDEFDRVTRPR